MCRPNNTNSLATKSNDTKSRSFTESIVPTFREPAPKQLDVSSLTSTSLASLKTEDPFMYNSIPAVKEAKMHGREEDASAILSSESKPSTVTRQRRHATECHPDVFLQDLLTAELMASIEEEMDALSFSVESLASAEGEDDFYDLLMAVQESRQ